MEVPLFEVLSRLAFIYYRVETARTLQCVSWKRYPERIRDPPGFVCAVW